MQGMDVMRRKHENTVGRTRASGGKRPLRVAATGLLGALALSLLTAADTPEPTTWLATPAARERMKRVEEGLAAVPIPGEEPLRLSLERWMALYAIPGLSIAVFDQGELVWAKGYGVKEAGGTEPVTPETMFQAASIGKTLTAVAVAHHAEQRRWSLDQDVNTLLRTWKVPDNGFTKKRKVTLRRLLSHSAGVANHAPQGYLPTQTRPTLTQVLEGGAPALTPPVRVVAEPGSTIQYSNAGLAIVQQLMVDQLGLPFPRLMEDAVLSPLGMAHSTFEQPLPSNLATQAATATRADGASLEGRWRTYPEMAAAGLWTTPSDLARFALGVSRAWAGEPGQVLSQKMARQVLSPQEASKAVKPRPGPWQREVFGLGFRLPLQQAWFGHGGWSDGYRAQLTAFASSGSGFVLMANSDNATFLFPLIADSIVATYGWKGYTPKPVSSYVVVDLLVRLRGVDEALTWFRARHAAGAPDVASPEVLDALGHALRSVDKVADAVKVFETNAALFPGGPEVHTSLGDAYVDAKREQDAVTCYRRALELAPGDPEVRERLEKLVPGPPAATPRGAQR